MTMNTEEIRRQGMSKMLPELARIINSIFVTEKKSVLPLKQLIEKIQYSHRGIMSASSVEEHIRLIRTVYPEWLDVLSRGNIDYVKVDRKIDSNIVYQKMEDSSKSWASSWFAFHCFIIFTSCNHFFFYFPNSFSSLISF